MLESRTKNASRNIAFGGLQRIVALVFPFIVRTILIYVLGAEYLGLSSLFSSILQVLSLTELGVGTALVYSMYKPIAEDDLDTVCALLKLYRKIYTIIGVSILIIGILLSPLLGFLIHGDVPSDINIYVLYAIYIMNSTVSYLFFGYKQAIITASQRSDITSKINLLANLLMYSFQIVFLLLVKNYYLYIILLPISTMGINVINAVVANKMYPQYKCYGLVDNKLKNSIIKKTIALFGTKLSSIVLHAADAMVISAFLGLTQVAIYGNYYYIMDAILGFVMIVFGSMTASIGNSIITESNDKNYFDFCKLTFGNYWIVAFCSTCLLCLYQPFMKLWVGESLIYPDSVMFFFVVYFFVYQIRRVVLTYKDAAGIWWEDRFRPYVIMIFNLATNILLIQYIGIYGVIISTLISMFISIPWENYTVFKYIFHMSSKQYYKKTLIYTVVSIIIMLVTYFICSLIPLEGWEAILGRLILCCLIPNFLLYICFRNTKEYQVMKITFTAIIKRKI